MGEEGGEEGEDAGGGGSAVMSQSYHTFTDGTLLLFYYSPA